MSCGSESDVIITDLQAQVLAGPTSNVRRAGHWQVIPYELEQLGSGQGLFVDEERPGPITLRLGVTGPHRISFVTRYTDVRAKLTGDRCFHTCHSVGGQQWYGMARSFNAEEAVWREADLTGQDLIIDGGQPTYLLALRLSPAEPPPAGPVEVRWPMAFTNL